MLLAMHSTLASMYVDQAILVKEGARMLDFYDVLVVGSGASGGWACKRLAEAGLKVALVDAGRPQSDTNFAEHVPRFRLKYRNLAPEVIRRAGRPIQNGSVDGEYNYDWACNDSDEPYHLAEHAG
ncbi:MAG: FAD-binding protein [Acidobacteriaceae bacterium]